MKISFFLSFLLFIFVTSIQKYENIKDVMKDYPQKAKKGKPPKFLYFKMSQGKDLDYFSKILYKFMSTMGVRPYFVNLNDNQLLGIVPRDAEINTEAILDTFKGVVENIEIKYEMK